MIIPMFVHEVKDKELIDWLNSFTNRSAAIRMFLYQVKRGQFSGNLSQSNKVDNIESKPLEIDDNLMDKFDNF